MTLEVTPTDDSPDEVDAPTAPEATQEHRVEMKLNTCKITVPESSVEHWEKQGFKKLG